MAESLSQLGEHVAALDLTDEAWRQLLHLKLAPVGKKYKNTKIQNTKYKIQRY
jgi:hypothetical protein